MSKVNPVAVAVFSGVAIASGYGMNQSAQSYKEHQALKSINLAQHNIDLVNECETGIRPVTMSASGELACAGVGVSVVPINGVIQNKEVQIDWQATDAKVESAKAAAESKMNKIKHPDMEHKSLNIFLDAYIGSIVGLGAVGLYKLSSAAFRTLNEPET